MPKKENKIDLKEYFEKSIEHEREIRNQIILDNTKALEIAKSNIELRLNAMNELREQINSERGKYLSRDVYDRINDVTDKRLQALELFSANIQGKIWMFMAVMGAITTCITIVITILGYFFRK